MSFIYRLFSICLTLSHRKETKNSGKVFFLESFSNFFKGVNMSQEKWQKCTDDVALTFVVLQPSYDSNVFSCPYIYKIFVLGSKKE